LEDAIRAARSGLVDDVLVFGNARPYPGALLFRSADVEGTSDRHVLNEISPTVERLNAESQSHARIPRNMLIPMPHDRKGLEKSSKGTVLRRTAEERYTDSIAAAYVDNRTSSEEIPDDQVSGEIRRIVTSVVSQNHSNDNNPSTLTDDTDLFAYGVDSVASIQIRQAISRLVPGQSVLPLNVVEDAGSISRLTRVVLQMRSGGPVETDGAVAAQHQLMLDLVKEYGVFNDRERPRSSPTALAETETEETTSDRNTAGIQVLLSGPTGSLGSHILHQLLSDRRVSKVHLLVRGASPGAARERVLKALSDRRLSVPDFDRRTVVWQCNKLSEASLGLSGDDYQHLARSVDVIVHLAWSVNFLLPLRSFATHLTGLRNLLNLALSAPTPPAFIFCSSVAAISNCQTTVPEEIVSDPCVSGPTGYARSKWVAEAVCGRAHEDTPLRGRVSVARVGQLSGASDTGMWSRTEAYPLMLSSVAATGVLPALKGEVLNWLPVDVAARAFVEDALLADTRDKGEEDGMEGSKAPGNGGGTAVPVHHVLNDDHGVRWTDLLAWLSRRESFQVVAVDEWLARLSNLPDDQSESKHHPALRLLGFWKSAYGQRRPEPTKGTHVARAVGEDQGRQAQSHLDHDERVSPTTEYDMSRTRARMPSLRSCPRVDGPYMRKLWAWIKENV
jgi:thioester reductase-like protein